jgi:hypothetical protein
VPYSIAWDEAAPIGASVAAADLDTELQNLKKSIRERMNDLVGAGNWENDSVNPKVLFGSSTNCRISKTVGSAVTSPIQWDTEDEDNGGFWDVAAPTNIVIPFDGVYIFTAGIALGDTGTITFDKPMRAYIYNGAVFLGAGEGWLLVGGGNATLIGVTTISECSASDVVTVTMSMGFFGSGIFSNPPSYIAVARIG